jgi:hypothetical protein
VAKIPASLETRPQKPLSQAQWNAAMLDVARVYGLEAAAAEIMGMPPWESRRGAAVRAFKEALLSKLLKERFAIFQAPAPMPLAGPDSISYAQRQLSQRISEIMSWKGKGPMWALKWICNEVEAERVGPAKAAQRRLALPPRYRKRMKFETLKQAWKELPEELRQNPQQWLLITATAPPLKKGALTFAQRYGSR